MDTPQHIPRIAYLTGQYPEVSLTFILREVEALRAMGVDVSTCSIRQTPPEQHPGLVEKEAARTTFHVLKAARNPRHFLAGQLYALTRPRRYLRSFKLALKTRPPGLWALIYQLIFFAEATVLARHLEKEGIQHLHNHFVFGSATVAMLASELTGIPFSFTLHGPADLYEPYRWALAEKTARAKFVSVISHYARSQLMFFSDPEHWDKIRIIHCGVTPDRYDPALYDNAETPITIPTRHDSEIRLLFVGRLAPVKGLRVLLQALEALRVDLPQLHLVLVGDGPDRANLEAAAADLGDRVSFTGYLSQDQVAHAMQAADIIVLPSFAEGVPVVLMEAFASTKPVIATQVAGVGELVEDGVSGFLVPPGDMDTLAARIRTLAGDPELRARMGQHGAQTVKRDFDITQEAARLATLFAGAAGDDIRPSPLQVLPKE
jgi:glycosyltransferase involved in cell wall biosynthesis